MGCGENKGDLGSHFGGHLGANSVGFRAKKGEFGVKKGGFGADYVGFRVKKRDLGSKRKRGDLGPHFGAILGQIKWDLGEKRGIWGKKRGFGVKRKRGDLGPHFGAILGQIM